MKAIKIIQSFSKAELKQFGIFLHSPFFNSDSNLKKLFSIFAKYHPSYSSPRFTKEKNFQKVFPNHEWHDGKWRNLLSKMVKALEQFLVVVEIKSNRLEEQKIFIKAFDRRNLNGLFKKQIHLLIEKLSGMAKKDHQVMLDKMLFIQFYYYHPSNSQLENRRFLFQANKEASHYFKALQYKMESDILVFKQIVGSEQQEELLEKKKPIYLRLYEMVHSFLSEGSYEAFEKAKEFIQSNIDNLAIQDQKFGVLHLINFSIRQYNLGVSNFNKDILELYQLSLDRNILMDNGILTEKTFDNIVMVSCGLKNHDWAHKY